MKNIKLFILTAIAALMVAACEAPADNKPAANANTNTNTAKPTAAAPTVGALLEMEKKAFEAWAKKDGKHFEGLLADNFVGFEGGKRTARADEIKMITESKCEVTSHTISDEKMVPIGPDAAMLVTKAAVEGTCDGQKIPNPMTAVTLFVRSGDAWKAAYHNQVAIIDPKSPPPAAPAKPASAAKKDEPKKADSLSDDAVAESAAAETADNDLTKSLVSLETSGWEAWKAKDSAKLGSLITNDVTFVDPMGTAHFGKDANMKVWADDKCDVKSVALTEGKGTSVLPTVALLTFKGTVDGTCNGQKLGSIWGTAVYLKEGDAWKLAFHFEAPA